MQYITKSISSINFEKVFQAASATASVLSGISAYTAAGAEGDNLEREADFQREQGDIARSEANREADRIKRLRKAELSKSAMRFISGGVSLQGSPLFLLLTQDELDEREVEAIQSSGEAKQQLAYNRAEVTDTKADITRNKGRGALIGGLGQGIGTASQLFT